MPATQSDQETEFNFERRRYSAETFVFFSESRLARDGIMGPEETQYREGIRRRGGIPIIGKANLPVGLEVGKEAFSGSEIEAMRVDGEFRDRDEIHRRDETPTTEANCSEEARLHRDEIRAQR